MRLILLCLAALLLSLPGRAGPTGDGSRRSAGTAEAALAETALEAAYSARAGQSLRQFGYDLFAGPPPLASPIPAPVLDRAADDHVLGVGDAVTVVLRGQTATTATYRVGSDGQLVIDELLPLAAAGRTLAAVRAEIEAAVSTAMAQTRAFVSLAEARPLSVLVLGAVPRPGRQTLSPFASVLDALLAAGGVLPGGSLRDIRLLPPGEQGPGRPVDLYALLDSGGGAATARIADGSRLLVPPLGPTLAVAGGVRRPGIYELAPGERPDLARLLAWAGGALHPGPHRLLRLGYGADGAERATAVEDGATGPASADGTLFADGDILLLAPRRDDRQGVVQVEGRVRQPGPRPLDRGGGLERLLTEGDPAPDAYRPLAVLVGASGQSGTLRAVSLDRILAGQEPVRPAGGDTLLLLGEEEIRWLSSRSVLAVLAGRPPADRDCPGLDTLIAALAAETGRTPGPLTLAAAGLDGPDLPCPPLMRQRPELVPFLLSHAVLLRQGVLRPGLYPLAPGLTLAALREAAGGPLDGPAHPGQVVDLDRPAVELAGAVRHPGRVALEAAGTTLRALLADALTPEAYPLFAVLERRDARSLSRSRMPFAPADILTGHLDRRLQDGDRVLILDRTSLERLVTSPPTPGLAGDPDTGEAGQEVDATPAAALLSPWPGEEELARLLAAHLVQVRGAVAAPGAYPVADTVELARLLQVAGGLARHADPALLEVTTRSGSTGLRQSRRLADPVGVRLEPGDSVRVGARYRPGPAPSITLAGEVAQPGTYDIAPGEKLSSVLARAGGLTPQAYPAGAIFTRRSARRAEEEALRRAARDVDHGLAQALTRSNPPDAARVELARALADDLRHRPALGRITVEADPAALAARPELDIVLEPGDRLLLPRRPLTVTVAGEVLSPASLQFAPEKEAEDYLRQAGGLTRAADRGRAFLIYPDGSAQPLSGLSDRHRLELIPPGSVLVVPRDPDPFEFLPVAQGVTTILGQLALTAAAIASLDDH